MTRFKCLSCRGTYDDAQGTYYHACPPGTVNPRDENLDPNAPLVEFRSERGAGFARKQQPTHEGNGRVEVKDEQ